MSEWVSAGLEPRVVAGVEVLTIRYGHTSESGHEVALGARKLRVLPDGRTTAKRRSWTISQALEEVQEVLALFDLLDDELGVAEGLERLVDVKRAEFTEAHLLGRLLQAGAHRLEWLEPDGTTTPLIPRADAGLQWVVEVDGDGIHVRRVGGGE